ncbi:membrane protein insertase YidC [Caenimonas koreensis]|uniref:membrane protein insertase YidC n=1 Tax=Caenimonas koreensis TaxID=367474 RepID=UPI0037852B29
MNDIRRTILWVIFGFSMVLLWDQWQVHNGNKATFFPSMGKPIAAASAPAGAASGSSAATASASSVPGASPVAAAAAGATPVPVAAPAPAAQKVTVTTDLMRITFDTAGGSIVREELIHQLSDDKKSNVVLLNDAPGHRYVAETGLIDGNFPNHTTAMTFTGDLEMKAGANELVARFESPVQGGVKLVKTYTFRRGHYEAVVRHEVTNVGTTPVTPRVYMQIVRDGSKLEAGGSFFSNPTSTYTGPAIFTEEKKYQKVEFADIEKNKADYAKESASGYVAMVQHYFASAWILPAGVKRENFVRKIDTNMYSVGVMSQLPAIAPGATQTLDATFFAGPQEETKLEKITPDLERVKDYGMFHIIAKPLYWLLATLHGYLGNWGWSIMALVLLIKIAFYWLQAKGYQSMAKMKAINPRIMAMRERYKDKPQEMQQEMMKIYREEKVNPMGGCLPIMVQIPVFIALYWVLLSSVEMRGAPWVGWIHDLSAPDPFFILPLVMTLTTLLQTALNPTPPDPMQAKMMWLMPLAFSVMFFFFPSGLVLYWITNNVLSIAQQWLINTRMGVPPEFNLPKFR